MSSYDRSSSQAHVEFQAKSTWTLIRGNRYQVLEEEFFRFVLAPHADALRAAYGLGHEEIATGIQAIADVMRSGLGAAVEGIRERMDQARALVGQTGQSMETILERLKADPAFQSEATDLISDVFFGGTCDLSRHSRLPRSLLEDLSYSPGENVEFYAPGDFCGTPMRTLPARVKPGIRLGDEFYTTDGQFIRDSAYRTIQRGLCSRLSYRDEWSKRQGKLIERALPAIFSKQLAGAEVIDSVRYRDGGLAPGRKRTA